MEVRAIRQQEREECLQLWCTAFPHTSRSYFERYFYHDTEWQPEYTRVAVVQGRIVSCVQIIRRTAVCGEATLTMGGIANVSTLPQERGKGYNMACLLSALQVMEADAIDFSVLGTGIPEYYERIGFCNVAQARFTGTLPYEQDLATPLSLRPALPADAPHLHKLHRTFNARRPASLIRTASYWRGWMGVSSEAMPKGWYAACSGSGEPVGYVHMRYSEKAGKTSLTIDEAASCRIEEYPDVLLAALAEARQQGTGVVHLNIPLENALPQMKQKLGNLRKKNESGRMMRLLDRTSVLRGMLPELTERWHLAGRPQGSLAFQTPYGPVLLNAENKLKLEEAEQAALGQADFFQMLFHLPDTQQARRKPNALQKALMPVQTGFYYDQDEF